MTARTAPKPMLPEMTEAELLDAVRKLSLLTGWLFYHTHDSRRSDSGWPDTVLLNVRQRRILFVELKTRTGRVRPMQGVRSRSRGASADSSTWPSRTSAGHRATC